MAKKRKGPQQGSQHIDKRAARLLKEAVSDGPDDEQLTREQVAHWLGISVGTLDKYRDLGSGPRFVRISPKVVRYARGAVRAWLKRRSYLCTSEYIGGDDE